MLKMVWILVVAIGLTLAGDALAGRLLRVGVKDAPLRAAAMPFGQVLKTLHYGDAVEVLEEKGAWMHVRVGTADGWMHGSMLSAKVTALKAGQGDARSAASQDELTLAGKGFNSQVESEYRRQNSKLDYALIDRMGKLAVTPEQMSRFVQAGGLVPAGGTNAP